MKKLLLLVILFSGIHFISSGQSLVISDSSGAFPPGQTITVTVDPGVPDYSIPFDCTNTSTDTISVKVKKVEISILTGTTNAFCWVQCYPPHTYVSPDALSMAPGFTSSLFTGDYFPDGKIGTTEIAYVFYDENNTDDSTMIIVKYVTGYVGIADLFASGKLVISDAYPNPANSTVTFNINIPQELSGGKLIVRNILGSVILEKDINNNSGKILLNVADLSEGVYLYSFILDNETAITKKLIIKR